MNAEPRLINVDGSTRIRIKGFGFVNSSETKGQFSSTTPNQLLCNGGPCIKDAEFIDKYTLEVGTFP